MMLSRTRDNGEIIERVAALDIGKAELMCCVRVPDEDHPGRRLQEAAAYPALTRALLGLAGHLSCLGVTRVVMEATADYGKPVFYLLEAAGFETWLVSAKDVKHLPGRRPASWMRSGCARSPGGRCCGPVLSRPRRSAGCAT
jgi:transposase